MKTRRVLKPLQPLPLLLFALLWSCFPSNVVAVKDRDVILREEIADWKPARAESIPGLYSSGLIEGQVAASILQLYYLLEKDGDFAGAVLLASTPPHFEVLSGKWTFTDGTLRLGPDAEPAKLEEAENMLRLRGRDGVVVLYREELH